MIGAAVHFLSVDATNTHELVLTGDFNPHLDDHTDHLTSQFLSSIVFNSLSMSFSLLIKIIILNVRSSFDSSSFWGYLPVKISYTSFVDFETIQDCNRDRQTDKTDISPVASTQLSTCQKLCCCIVKRNF